MNQQNNILGQGSPLEQPKTTKTNILVPVVLILGAHMVLLGALLLQGCKDKSTGSVADNSIVTNLPSITFSNPPTVDVSQPMPPPLVAQPQPQVAPPQPMTVSPTVGGSTGLTPPPVGQPTPDNTAGLTSSTGGLIEHKIEKGESFATIAKKYGVSVDAIVKANPNINPRRLQIGQIIKVPEKSGAATTATPTSANTVSAAATKTAKPQSLTEQPSAGAGSDAKIYVVKPGDNLTKIAKSHGVKVTEIKAVNNLNTDRINVGQKIKIPVKNSIPTNPPTTPATDNMINDTARPGSNV
ncbi:MAG: LysM peptidoglycan-binding domain-containing protein [Verrucomicrobiia bacterium]|jgi:LysM repeat protein